MIEQIPRQLRWVVPVALWVGINLGLTLGDVRLTPQSKDWQLWTAVAHTATAGGDLYATRTEVAYVWSPLMAPVLAGVVWLGYWPWVAAHLAALLQLRDARLIILVLVSWGFWTDVAAGNFFTFVFVAAALTVRGSLIAGITSIGLFLLMPRIVQVPLAVWVLWRMPRARLPAAILFGVQAVVVFATGTGFDWLAAMLGHAIPPHNIGPSYFMGLWWLAIGVPLGLWAWSRGWIGTAGLFLNTYLLPQYLVLPLIDLPLWRRQGVRQSSAK